MPGLDFTQYVILAATIAGVVELITRVRAKDWWAVITIASSGFVGFLFGVFGYYPDLDAVEGMVAGLSVSGVISAIGFKRSTPAPSDPLQKS